MEYELSKILSPEFLFKVIVLALVFVIGIGILVTLANDERRSKLLCWLSCVGLFILGMATGALFIKKPENKKEESNKNP